MDPQQAYADASTAVSDPDHAGYLMYRAVAKECHAMRQALMDADWPELVRAGHHAQQILAALHDLANPARPHGPQFRLSNRWAWREVGRVVREHEAFRLDPVSVWAETLATQLYHRLVRAGEDPDTGRAREVSS